MRQRVLSIFGDNLGFYFSTIVQILTLKEDAWLPVQKSHPSPDDFGETFAFNLIKQNLTQFSFIFLTQNIFAVPFEILNLNNYCQVL